MAKENLDDRSEGKASPGEATCLGHMHESRKVDIHAAAQAPVSLILSAYRYSAMFMSGRRLIMPLQSSCNALTGYQTLQARESRFSVSLAVQSRKPQDSHIRLEMPSADLFGSRRPPTDKHCHTALL